MADREIVVTKEQGTLLLTALEGGRPVYLTRLHRRLQGGFFVGRVENCLNTLQAAFVRFQEKEIGYLSYTQVPDNALYNRPYRRGERLRPGDMLAVQVQRAAQDTKKAKLTGALSLSGHYAVLTFGSEGLHGSGKLQSELRTELLHAVRAQIEREEELPEHFLSHYGVILRTEAGTLVRQSAKEREASEPQKGLRPAAAQIVRELCALWRGIKEIADKGRTRKAGQVLYLPPAAKTLEERVLRLLHFLEASAREAVGEPVRLLCEDSELYAPLCHIAASTGEERLCAELQEDAEASLTARYGLKSKLSALASRFVRMKSGAYLLIDETEAMTVIDVNSGKDIKDRNDGFLRVNLEAADESMRQIRLRGMTGIVVIDFINMSDGAHYALLGERLKTLAAQDPVETHFVDFTALGLAEITRSGIMEA